MTLDMVGLSRDVCANWINGNKLDALATLEGHGAVLTALVLTERVYEQELTTTDALIIANTLLMRHVDRAKAVGL